MIGLGSIGRRHATNLAELFPGADFTFVRRGGADDEFCRRLGARVVSDLGQVNDADIDLAVLATPSANHVDCLPELIGRGWPLLVEKPVVTESEHCDEIERLLSASPRAVRATAFNLRHLPSLAGLRDVITAGRLGNIVRASLTAGQWLPHWRPGTDYRDGYSAHAERGGGVELDLAHEFDVARWVLGDLAVDFARGGRFSDLDIHANDTSVAMLSPPDRASPVVSVSLDYVSRRRVRRYEFVGDRASVVWDLDGTLEFVTDEGRCPLPSVPSDFDVAASYVRMVRGVVAAVDRGDDSSIQTLGDGIASTRLALGVRDLGTAS